VLFAGVDPTPWVEALGREMGITYEAGNFKNISMGQGQEAPAEVRYISNRFTIASRLPHDSFLLIHCITITIASSPLFHQLPLFTISLYHCFSLALLLSRHSSPHHHPIPSGCHRAIRERGWVGNAPKLPPNAKLGAQAGATARGRA
jgi:hypothetical protein